nr:hypothetical protein [uncultured bacterium]
MMKKILTILILLISINSFSQEQQYEKVKGLYSNGKYEEAIPIIKDLLDNKYGKPAKISVFYLSYWIAASYENIENYSQATDKFMDYIELVNASDIFNKKTKEKLIKDVLIIIEELKFKMINSKKTEISSDTEIVVDTKTTESKTPLSETTDESSSNKTTTLVVTGQGKTKDEAQQNALRSAIEQAFGTFISSKTELLNDELVSDEIVSLSNGNIQKFEILSELQIPNGNYSITLKATVSVSKLTSFVESKGLEVEFKGSLFGANMRQQKSNEVAEFKAIINLCEASNEMLSKSLDYEVEFKEPTVAGNQPPGNPTKYEVLLIVTASTNTNYQTFAEYFAKTISFISMSESEVSNYKKLNKGVYALFIGGNKLFFRNPKTSIALQNLFLKSNKYLHNFSVSSNIGIIPLEINGPKKNSFYNGYSRQTEHWAVNSQGSGVGFPDFNFPRYGYTGSDERFLSQRSTSSSWKLYDKWIDLLVEENHKIFMDTTNYFNTISNTLKSNDDFKWDDVDVREGGPANFKNYIGMLNLYPTSHLSLYKAVFSEEDLTKITGFSVKQLK